jgi:signal transduction histidine kinase
VSEVRETLYDLRTDVTEQQDLVVTLTGFLERVRSRSHIAVDFQHDLRRRLPLPIEREVWRIAQEAVTNVERHAHARNLSVRWSVSSQTARLEITDDGEGFIMEPAGRFDAYGLLGMRERADAIGGTLDISSSPGSGTRVSCAVDVQ